MKILKLTSFKIIFLFCLIGCSSNKFEDTLSKVDNLFTTKADSLINKLMVQEEISGVAVIAISESKVIFNKGYGFARISEDIPVSNNTIFNIASISKPVTTWGVLHLADRYDLNIDTPVNEYLKQWKIPDSNSYDANKITIRQLLSHTAGLSLPSAPFIPHDSLTPGIIETFKAENLQITSKPGESWNYSGGGFMILELLIEDVSGKKFDAYMKNNLFEPLEMEHSIFSNDQDISKNLAYPYDEDNDVLDLYKVAGTSAGGMYTTLDDFAKFLQHYWEYKTPSAPFINDSLYTQMTTQITEVNLEGVENAHYGLGHGVHISNPNSKTLYHSGGNPGYKAYFMVNPKSKSGIAIFSNSDNSIPVLIEVINLWANIYDLDLQPIY